MSYPSLSTSQRIAIDRAIHTLEQEASDAWGREAAARQIEKEYMERGMSSFAARRRADSHKRHAEELRGVADELSTQFPKGD